MNKDNVFMRKRNGSSEVDEKALDSVLLGVPSAIASKKLDELPWIGLDDKRMNNTTFRLTDVELCQLNYIKEKTGVPTQKRLQKVIKQLIEDELKQLGVY